MGEVQQLPQDINVQKSEPENVETNKNPTFLWLKQYKWWIQMIIYSFLVLTGQSVGTLLGRVYFDNGGNSEWIATLVQVVGFPILIPFQWLTTVKLGMKKRRKIIEAQRSKWHKAQYIYNSITTTKNKHKTDEINPKTPFPHILASVYLALGIFLAADCMLYTIGLQYLPVTTYTLICASQLGFNALFSYFLNKQKFTPYIVNSVVLLTISSVLLVFQSDPGDSHKTSKAKYVIGFLSTLGASAGYALMLSITQLAFQKIIKKETIRSITDLLIYQNFVATLVIVTGLFASGDWKKMDKEMKGYKLGQVSYVMNLFWTTVSWQAFGVGCVGLIFKVSSLFSNVISILGLPVAPVLAVVFLRDRLTGLKGVAMVLAMWGFVSYMYQHYLDDLEEKKKKTLDEQVSEVSLVNERGS